MRRKVRPVAPPLGGAATQAARTTATPSLVPDVGWFDTDDLGIDQAPIVALLEHYRSGLVWRLSPYVTRGRCRAGFGGGWLEAKC